MSEADPVQFIRPEVLGLSAYHVTDADGFIKLDAMENPYAWPGELLTEWQQVLAQVELNRYPLSSSSRLKARLFETFGPRHDSLDMLFGNGSDEIIQLLVMATATHDASMLTVTPSFSMYRMICTFVGVPCIEVPLMDDYRLDLNAMLASVREHRPAVIFLAYPNNPTGNLWDADVIQKIIDTTSGLVVIDEAYAPFSSSSLSCMVIDRPNVLLLKTASKLGLAGIRFGWLTGKSSLIAALDKIRLPYNINSLTQITMQFALDHYDILASQANVICEQRSRLSAQLKKLTGVTVFPSEANFILFKVPAGKANRVFERLLSEKVLIKNVSLQANLADCLRVTVGTPAENEKFIRVLRSALNV